jgi:hypothetical protein
MHVAGQEIKGNAREHKSLQTILLNNKAYTMSKENCNQRDKAPSPTYQFMFEDIKNQETLFSSVWHCQLPALEVKYHKRLVGFL